MKIVEGNLFDFVNDGKNNYIMHQVNCQNKMGSGFAREFLERYPLIKESYHRLSSEFEKRGENILGHLHYVQLSDKLFGVNSFTQEFYGNSSRTGMKYTDEDLLIRNVGRVLSFAKNYNNGTVYIPEFIGCGLAGGDWEKVLEGIEEFDTDNLVMVRLVRETSEEK